MRSTALADVLRSRSEAFDLGALPWARVPDHPFSELGRRTLRYMQEIESHTAVYARTLLSTRAIDEPEVAAFLARWLYEESAHGLALARFLEACGEAVPAPRRARPGLRSRLRATATGLVSRAWPHFVAVHMTWGAINELLTLTGYQRLARLERHPVLAELLARIVRDEARHFQFYFAQARRRLVCAVTRRRVRTLVERFWAPVGSGEKSEAEMRRVAGYLFAGGEGRAAARKLDDTLRALPGFEEIELFEAWLDS